MGDTNAPGCFHSWNTSLVLLLLFGPAQAALALTLAFRSCYAFAPRDFLPSPILTSACWPTLLWSVHPSVVPRLLLCVLTGGVPSPPAGLLSLRDGSPIKIGRTDPRRPVA